MPRMGKPYFMTHLMVVSRFMVTVIEVDVSGSPFRFRTLLAPFTYQASTAPRELTETVSFVPSATRVFVSPERPL